jgi:hypothetical protein
MPLLLNMVNNLILTKFAMPKTTCSAIVLHRFCLFLCVSHKESLPHAAPCAPHSYLLFTRKAGSDSPVGGLEAARSHQSEG